MKFSIIKRKFKIILFVRVLGILALLAVIFFGLQYIKNYQGFRVSSISVSGTEKYVSFSDLTIVAENLLLGKNIFSINNKSNVENLVKTFQGAKKISLKKHFPSTIEIRVTERVPVCIFTDELNSQYIVDIDGYVLGLKGDSYYDLPNVLFSQKIYIGTFINKDFVANTLAIIKSSKSENLNISYIRFTESYGQFNIINGPQVLIGLDKKIPESIKVVSEIVKKSDKEGKKLQKIDLRFNKVIVS